MRVSKYTLLALKHQIEALIGNFNYDTLRTFNYHFVIMTLSCAWAPITNQIYTFGPFPSHRDEIFGTGTSELFNIICKFTFHYRVFSVYLCSCYFWVTLLNKWSTPYLDLISFLSSRFLFELEGQSLNWQTQFKFNHTK